VLIGQVDHPVLLTEAPCNPIFSRTRMAELLFETYGVPSLGTSFLTSYLSTLFLLF
jgi:actin-related protein